MNIQHLSALKRTGILFLGMGMISLFLCHPAWGQTSSKEPEEKKVAMQKNSVSTDWFQKSGYGVFMHFLPGSEEDLKKVEQFDTEALASQLQEMGAKYFVLTLGQNSGYFNAPNAVYDKMTGYKAGERCSRRDLPMDLYKALKPRGIRLMLYLPAQTPNRDRQAQAAFGLPEGPADQPIDTMFAAKWAQVIQEWADRYKDKVSGWWFDGCYRHVHFNDAIAEVYNRAVKHGNPKSIAAFNPGIELIHYSPFEDYTAGETNEPLNLLPTSRYIEGSQWHSLTYIGSSWGQRDTRYTEEQWAEWVQKVVSHGGVVTLDMGPNYDASAGPIGTVSEAQKAQGIAIKKAVRPQQRGAAKP